MRFVSFTASGAEDPRVGALLDDRVAELPDRDLAGALGRHRREPVDVGEAVAEHPLEQVAIGAPVPRPSKIVCVGLNYVDHAAETEMELPQVPLLFAKLPNSITGPESVIELPPLTRKLDYEAELAVVIGAPARDVAPGEALGVVGGYMNLNDVSARDVQLDEGGQWTRGKSFDTFAPTGPFVLSADEVDDPQDLSIACRLNGETVQSSSTAQMVFSVAELVAFISRSTTLLPGDIIATGTPPGVGMGRRPPLYMADGDEVVVAIAGLGELRNVVRAGG